MSKEPLTEERIAEIKAREKAATPGPWVADEHAFSVNLGYNPDHKRTHGYGCGNNFVCDLNGGEYHEYYREDEQRANADFIAHAREDVPALLEEVERLRVESDQLRAQIDGLKECVGVHVFFTAMNPGADIGVARTKGKAQIDAIGVDAFLSVWKAACEDESNLPELKKMIMQFKD